MKILGITLLAILLLSISSWVLIQTGPVQNWLIRQVTSSLSKDLNTTVEIEEVDFALFNKMLLKGALVKDRNQDTLLYAGMATVRITDWFFLKDKAVLEYIGLDNTRILLHRKDSVWNYQFLIDYFSSPSTSTKKKSIELDLKKIEITQLSILKKDEWRGENQALALRSLLLDADKIDLLNKSIRINSINIIEPVFAIYNYPGFRPPLKPVITPDNEPSVVDTNLIWNPGGWNLIVNVVDIKNGVFKSDRETERQAHYYFDGSHIMFSDINSHLKNISFIKDTLLAQELSLTTKERSGFEVKKFNARFKFQPKEMEFSKLDIRTPKSSLKNYFSMHYAEFDDMAEFIEKVRMEGRFEDAEIDSDDIAYFAPELEKWNKHIKATGVIKGRVNNLSGKNLIIEAGKNTFLNGDIKLVGLPDIEETFIDFKANDFKTTYIDAVTLIPELKKIDEPRIDRLQYLRFKGNFTGFIRDFVTFGTIETNLGTLVTDLNMKLPEKGLSRYSGKVNTKNFKLGAFIGNDQIGDIGFNGTVKGDGFSWRNLSAELDGKVEKIGFNNYLYKNIIVKGKISKRLFNGHLVSKDENLMASLDGLIDFRDKVPRFDFSAIVDQTNLKKLNFTKDDIDFNGNFRFNFTGDNIDNFLGTARIYEASVFKNGQRLSFDSLTLESKLIDNSKSIVVLSNEFDAALVGEFSIQDLPSAFQTFLNRYYPSYIKPYTKKLREQNFSFVVTTKKVDEYLDLWDKNFTGFDNSNLSGRIDTKNNLFDLDADVPKFAYKSTAFYDVNVRGRGNRDTLSLTSKVGDVYLNDSLHFPGTEISIRSSNDLSEVNINTSANQTLNAATISGQVQTLRNGVRILFNPSTFDINSKRWTIDKGGELILSKELVTTEGLRIYSGEQEVFVNSTPSEIGNSNDLQINLKKINIGDFTPFFVKKNRMEGLLNGSVVLIDPLGKLQVDVHATAEQFRLDNDSIGKLTLTSNYQQKTGKVNFGAVSENENYNFDLSGIFDAKDSTGNELDIVTKLRNTNINLLQTYLGGIFSRISGKATGDLRITGPSKSLKYLGNISLKDGGMMVDYTQCYYKIPAATFSFKDGLIDFGTFTIKDTLNNSGEIIDGKLYHQAFDDMVFDFRMRSNRLLVLNTKPVDNKQFYGNVVAKVNMSLTGPMDDMEMDIKGEPVDTSHIYLPISSSRSTGQADYIVWKVYGTEMKPFVDYDKKTNLTVKLDINANRFAKASVILDELTGDIITANGNGNLKIQVGTREALSMNGRLDIDEGDYAFSFQSIKRKFKLQPQSGNSITWNGDPYEAILNIDAVYEAENVRFSDLLAGSNLGSLNSENVKKYRGKVLVIATITERLTKPAIKFRIELPPNSPIRNDPDATIVLQRIERDENELNKQVSFLILFNSFSPLPPAGASTAGNTNIANAAFEGIFVNSISGFLSGVLTKEASNLLQKFFNDKSLQVNINATLYNGSNLISNVSTTQLALPDRTNFNFSIGKSFFNERLTFVFGSALDFGLNSTQAQASTLQFLPDVTAEYKLTPDGKFLLTFFYRDNYSYISNRALNRSGGSISYRREFDRIDEIFKSKKKEKKDSTKTN